MVEQKNINISIIQAVGILNQAVKADKNAIAQLIDNRVNCNEHLANHPTIQVMHDTNGHRVGLLGILNGLFGVNENGWGYIAVQYENGDLKGFKVLD